MKYHHRSADFDLIVTRTGRDITIKFTPSPEIDSTHIRDAARNALFSMLDALDILYPPDLTVTWNPGDPGN